MVKLQIQNTHLSNAAWLCRHVSTARTKDKGPRVEDPGLRTQHGRHRMQRPAWGTQDPRQSGLKTEYKGLRKEDGWSRTLLALHYKQVLYSVRKKSNDKCLPWGLVKEKRRRGRPPALFSRLFFSPDFLPPSLPPLCASYAGYMQPGPGIYRIYFTINPIGQTRFQGQSWKLSCLITTLK